MLQFELATSSHPLVRTFTNFIADQDFPCVGAKAALNRNGMHFLLGRDFRSAWDDLSILPALHDLAKRYRRAPELFQSLVVLFQTGVPGSEEEFESVLWTRLQSLSEKDHWLGQIPDPRVSHDPSDPHFALSFGGEAFFVVGLHPLSSRPARQFATPAIVFNLHDQFQQLRAQGRFEKMSRTIIQRDEKLAGTSNPMLAEHGKISAARQYSGRAVDADWECPFAGRSGASKRDA